MLLGLGVRVDMEQNALLLGSPRLMTQSGVPMPDEAAEWIAQMNGRAETPICLSSNDRLVGLLGVTDALRAESRELLQRLSGQGIRRVVMFTGDNFSTAGAVADQLGIEEWVRRGPARDQGRRGAAVAGRGAHRGHGR